MCKIVSVFLAFDIPSFKKSWKHKLKMIISKFKFWLSNDITYLISANSKTFKKLQINSKIHWPKKMF